MRRQMMFLVVLRLFVSLLYVSAKEETHYFAKGRQLSLRPAVPERITSIAWKFNGNLVCEWVEDAVPLRCYGSFERRTHLDIVSGRLEINNTSPADVGSFTLEVNDNESDKYTTSLMEEVPAPEVWVTPLTCDSESDRCSLRCDGDISGAEPITYSWKRGDNDWTEGEKTLNITNDETTQGFEYFYCQLKNPVSAKESSRRRNPFYTQDTSGQNNNVPVDVIIISVGAVCFVLSAVGCLLCYRQSIRRCLGRRKSISAFGNRERPAVERGTTKKPPEERSLKVEE